MIEPPFLELEYIVRGEKSLSSVAEYFGYEESAVRKDVRSKLRCPNILGIAEHGIEEIEKKGEVLLVRTEGESFCGYEREDKIELNRKGKIIYQKFREISCIIDFVYGAILVEYSLETPSELEGSKSYAFRNFCVSAGKFDQDTIESILSVAGQDSYIECDEAGLYVSMSSEFNPEGRNIPNQDAVSRSVRIGKILSDKLNQPTNYEGSLPNP